MELRNKLGVLHYSNNNKDAYNVIMIRKKKLKVNEKIIAVRCSTSQLKKIALYNRKSIHCQNNKE